ncbi:MAG: LptA/OstA family protein [Xanthobacteraceae bacterium]|jgi:lipopolysaccharide export system protein LptA
MKHRRRIATLTAAMVFAAAAAMAFAATTAMAQGPRPALPGQQQGNDQPIQIDAKSLEVHDKNKQATFSGNVKVVQGDTTMTCKKLVVFYGQELGIGEKPVVTAKTQTKTTSDAPPDAQSIRRIEARGDVTVLTKDQSASGDLGVYDVIAKTITLTGSVVVTQGQNVIHGGRVVVNTVTGNAHVEAAPGITDGRVRALIIPSKDNKGGQGNFMTIGPGASQKR